MNKYKRCMSCGDVFTEEEADKHAESNDCPSIGFVGEVHP